VARNVFKTGALQNRLDDYQHVALSLADWSVLDARATVTVFNDLRKENIRIK